MASEDRTTCAGMIAMVMVGMTREVIDRIIMIINMLVIGDTWGNLGEWLLVSPPGCGAATRGIVDRCRTQRHNRCIASNMDVPVQLRDTVCVLGTSQNLALRMIKGVYLEVFTVVVVVICCGSSVWGQGLQQHCSSRARGYAAACLTEEHRHRANITKY